MARRKKLTREQQEANYRRFLALSASGRDRFLSDSLRREITKKPLQWEKIEGKALR